MSEANTVIEPIERSWHELDALVEKLGPEGLALKGSDGWTVKDHLDHVAAWEKSLIALLDGSNRASAMGISVSGDEDTDAVNDAIWKLHRDDSMSQGVAYFRNTHHELMERLGRMSDEDLQRPYNDYQPNDPRDPDDNRPTMEWVAGNTWEHYHEHLEWINQLIKESSQER
jgi:hypothetical protein